MSKTVLLEQLFAAHTADLIDVMADLSPNLVPSLTDRVLCPICLVGYPKEAIYDGTLSDGHIWQQFIRQRGTKARHYRVLICKPCNSDSGRRGDVQMQILEQIRSEEAGGHYRERRMQFAFGPGEQPVSLNITVTTTNADDSSINAKVNFPLSRNNPSEIARLKALSQDRSFSLIMPPVHGVKPRVGQVGWLTAAYLMAFQTFGYRYILHPWLEPVRQCIRDSFVNDNPVFPESDVLQIRRCDQHDYDDPLISVMVTPDGSHPVYTQVDFWNYHIRLPFHFQPEMLEAMIRANLPDDFVLPVDEGYAIGIEIHCTKANPHACTWDYVMGKPIPNPDE